MSDSVADRTEMAALVGRARAPRPAVLIIDADHTSADACRWVLTRLGCRVEIVGSLRAGLMAIRRARPAVVLTDERLPDGSGLDLIRGLRTHAPPMTVVLVGDRLTIATAVEAMRAGAVDVLEKPLRLDALVMRVADLTGLTAWRTPAAVSASVPPVSTARPGSVAERWAQYVLKACASDRDPRTLKLWATCAGVSYSSLREICDLVGIRPHDARDLTRVLRAVIQSHRQDCAPEVLIDVGDRRTSNTIFSRAGLDPAARGRPVPVDRFFESQRFVGPQNAGLRVLRHLLGTPAKAG